MVSSLTGMYTSNTLDLCSGHSGSGVIDTSTNGLVAVYTGAIQTSAGACSPTISGTANLFTPNINNAGQVSASTCERAAGGVSLACLSAKLPA